MRVILRYPIDRERTSGRTALPPSVIIPWTLYNIHQVSETLCLGDIIFHPVNWPVSRLELLAEHTNIVPRLQHGIQRINAFPRWSYRAQLTILPSAAPPAPQLLANLTACMTCFATEFHRNVLRGCHDAIFKVISARQIDNPVFSLPQGKRMYLNLRRMKHQADIHVILKRTLIHHHYLANKSL